MASKTAATAAAAEPKEVPTVRVLNDDRTWRPRRSDEESEEGLEVKGKVLLTLGVQVCALAPMPARQHNKCAPCARRLRARRAHLRTSRSCASITSSSKGAVG